MGEPSLASASFDLHGGGAAQGQPIQQVDGKSLIDIFAVNNILDQDEFSCTNPMSEQTDVEFGFGMSSRIKSLSPLSNGVWLRASYINHSCLRNSKKTYVGDLMVVRAVRPIKAGEEITDAYRVPSDEERQTKMLRECNFVCWCVLCRAEFRDGPVTWHLRSGAESVGDEFVDARTRGSKLPSNRDLLDARQLLQEFNGSYDVIRYTGLPRTVSIVHPVALVDIKQD